MNNSIKFGGSHGVWRKGIEGQNGEFGKRENIPQSIRRQVENPKEWMGVT